MQSLPRCFGLQALTSRRYDVGTAIQPSAANVQHNEHNPQKTVRHRLAGAADIGPGECQEFRLGNGDWPLRIIAVNADGELRVYRNRCPHAGWPLNTKPDSFLTADGEYLLCSGHGALFTPATGVCVAGPCVGAKLEPYTASVDADGTVIIDVPHSAFDA